MPGIFLIYLICLYIYIYIIFVRFYMKSCLVVQACHTKAEYDEYGASICRTNPVFKGMHWNAKTKCRHNQSWFSSCKVLQQHWYNDEGNPLFATYMVCCMNSQPNSDVVNSLHSHLYKFPQTKCIKKWQEICLFYIFEQVWVEWPCS